MQNPFLPGETRVRALRRWSENGLDELTLGLLLCLIGGMQLPVRILEHLAMILPLLMVACALAAGAALKKMRARLIFPRTGYVVFRPAVPRIWMILAFQGLATGLAMAAMFWRSGLPDLSRAWGPGFAFVIAACLAWAGVTYKLPQYLWLAGLSLLLGAIAFYAGAKIGGAIWVMAAIGLALALDGAVRMKRFLRTHPVIEDPHG